MSRQAFETFAQNTPIGRYSIQRDTHLGREDSYWSSHTQLMWDAWQASFLEPEAYRWRFIEGKDKTWRYSHTNPGVDLGVVEQEPLYTK